MSIRLKIFLVLWALLLPACVSTGTNINDRRLVSRIVVDQSTQSEVTALLGLPAKVVYGKGGEETWQYFQLTEVPRATNYVPVVKAFTEGFDWQTQKLVITFNQEGIVKHLERQQQPAGRDPIPY